MIQDELELKSRSFIVEITVVQGLVSFNTTSIQFGVLQLQQKFLTHFPKTYKIEVLSKSYNQQAFQIVWHHIYSYSIGLFLYHYRNYEAFMSLREMHAQKDICPIQLKSNPLNQERWKWVHLTIH